MNGRSPPLVGIWSPRLGRTVYYRALLDTGSAYCVMSSREADLLGIAHESPPPSLHVWGIGGPVSGLRIAKVSGSAGGEAFAQVWLVLQLDAAFLRDANAEEKCRRPDAAHPLTNSVVVGRDLLDRFVQLEHRWKDVR